MVVGRHICISAFIVLAVPMTGQPAKLVSGKSVKKADRTTGGKYLDAKEQICIWNGKTWHCEHHRIRSQCKECGGSSICEHGKRKYTCKECKSRKVLAVQPLIVSASDVAFGDAADDLAMSLALPPR